MKSSLKWTLPWLASCLLARPLTAVEQGSDGPSTEILHSSYDELVVQVRYPSPTIRRIEINREVYHHVTLPGLGTTLDPGVPQVPLDGRLIAVPPGTSPHLEIQEEQTEVLEAIDLPPAPELRPERLSSGEVRTELRYEQGPVYQMDEVYPAQAASLGDIHTIGGRHVVRLGLNPVRYHPGQRRLVTTREITLRVRFEPAVAKAPSRSLPDAAVYRRLLPSMVLNPDQLGAPAVEPDRAARSIPTGDWYDPQQPYLKLFIAEDGLYRISRAELESAGFQATSDPRYYQLFLRGKQIPIRVAGDADGRFDPGDAIEFYGEWNHGEGEYFDAYSDTAVYWLTIGDTPGRRAADLTSSTSASSNLTAIRVHRHIEEDHEYHLGDNSAALYDTETTDGEGWVWAFLNPSESLSLGLRLPTLQEASPPGSLRVRVRGTSAQQQNALDHKASFSLNDQPVGEIEFDDFSEAIFATSLPMSLLKEGPNSLSVRSEPTDVDINQFYVDWAEIDYSAPLEAVRDSLSFDLPEAWGTPAITLDISGFSSPDIRLSSQ
jgi:hypothetical protein